MKLSRTLVLGVALLVGGFAVWHFTRPKQQEAAAPPPVPVQVASARQTELPVYLTAIGTVTSLNSIEIRPQVGGVLMDVPVKEGDQVKKGQVLAVIDPRPFQAALDKAKAQLVQDQAQLQNAQLDYKRYSALAKSDFASRQQVDTQVATVNRLQGVVAADQASIEEAQINLGYTVLKSPIDGMVGLRRVDPGNLVQANSTGPGIFLVVQYQPISVIFNLPETELPTVRDAMRQRKLPVLADSADEQRVLGKGELVVVDNAVDSASGTIPLRADFPNPDQMLAPGQFVNVRLQVEHRERRDGAAQRDPAWAGRAVRVLRQVGRHRAAQHGGRRLR